MWGRRGHLLVTLGRRCKVQTVACRARRNMSPAALAELLEFIS
jgi:hypothetical protein